ncbi:MAG: ABC transporter ATP-binding protein [Candidatus Eremiobacteraeota bacterium]|nr:ABC transporter ATP-binding protein [Candidatus Eremiobacteraeota bacterium]
METDSSLLLMKGITKRFPGIVANDDVTFELRAGEIHALLGENGAGKSTLMSILSGLYFPDKGEILMAGKPVSFRSPGESLRHGIAMIYQHFMLVESHTVCENIILGRRETGIHLPMARLEGKIEELSLKYRLAVSPRSLIWQLSVGEQQRVEILKALYRDAKILVMDEPTAVLTPQETRELFTTLRLLAGQGHAIVFISHKLEEVMALSSRVTVMKAGRVEGTVNTAETTAEGLARMMVGRDVKLSRFPSEPPGLSEALVVKDLHVRNERGLPALRGVSFTIQKGEIVGIAGVAGNGQKELSEALNGLRPIEKGTITLLGKEVARRSPREHYREGMAFIPADRLAMGLVPTLPVDDNFALREYDRPPFSRGPFIDSGEIGKAAKRAVAEYGIKVPKEHYPVKLMSGGNLQKLLFSRELHGGPKVLVAVHPTRGLDIGAVEFVHEKLRGERQAGTAILLISEDLEELLLLSDRIAVIYEGKITGIVEAGTASIEELGLMMSGSLRREPGD